MLPQMIEIQNLALAVRPDDKLSDYNASILKCAATFPYSHTLSQSVMNTSAILSRVLAALGEYLYAPFLLEQVDMHFAVFAIVLPLCALHLAAAHVNTMLHGSGLDKSLATDLRPDHGGQNLRRLGSSDLLNASIQP